MVTRVEFSDTKGFFEEYEIVDHGRVSAGNGSDIAVTEDGNISKIYVLKKGEILADGHSNPDYEIAVPTIDIDKQNIKKLSNGVRFDTFGLLRTNKVHVEVRRSE